METSKDKQDQKSLAVAKSPSPVEAQKNDAAASNIISTPQSNINSLNNTKNSNNIEFNKLQGFDVLEKLPGKNFNDTYNQEFYNTLDNLKFLSLSIPDEDKLFYHFEQNENASISANAGQVLKSFMDDLKKAGAEYCANNFKLDPETIRKLQIPLLSPEGFATLTSSHLNEGGWAASRFEK